MESNIQNIWEEKNLTELRKKFESNGEFVECDITINTNISNKNEHLTGITNKKIWKRQCPICNKELIYSGQSSFCRARKYNSSCSRCPQIGTKNHRYGKRKDEISSWKGYMEIGGAYWSRVIFNAKKRNLVLEVSLEDIWDKFIKQNKKCALSGVDLCFRNIHDMMELLR